MTEKDRAKALKKITENDIQKAMKNLEISREDAIEMLIEDWEVDHMTMGQVLNDLTDEQKKAQKDARKSERKKSTSKPKREKKIDNEKKEIISTLVDALGEMAHDVEIVNDEREFLFFVGDTKYKLTLAKPRK